MLDKQTLINEALAQAKRTSFLDDSFEPVLDRLLTALNTEASLNEVGAGFQAQLPIESFSTTEKTDAGLLHQVIQIIETLTLQSRGHKTCKPQMLQGQVIALSNRGRHRALPLVSQR